MPRKRINSEIEDLDKVMRQVAKANKYLTRGMYEKALPLFERQ